MAGGGAVIKAGAATEVELKRLSDKCFALSLGNPKAPEGGQVGQ